MREENDLRLTRYLRKMKKRLRELDAVTTASKLDLAFLRAAELEEEAEKFQKRLNELRWHPMREPMGG